MWSMWCLAGLVDGEFQESYCPSWLTWVERGGGVTGPYETRPGSLYGYWDPSSSCASKALYHWLIFPAPWKSHYYILLSILRVHICIPQHMNRGQRTTCRSQFSPLTYGTERLNSDHRAKWQWPLWVKPNQQSLWTILQELWCQGFSWIASFH